MYMFETTASIQIWIDRSNLYVDFRSHSFSQSHLYDCERTTTRYQVGITQLQKTYHNTWLRFLHGTLIYVIVVHELCAMNFIQLHKLHPRKSPFYVLMIKLKIPNHDDIANVSNVFCVTWPNCENRFVPIHVYV